MPNTISVAELKAIGHTARSENGVLETVDIDGKNVRGMCIDIADDMLNGARSHGLPDDAVYKVRCYVNGEELHYCLGVESEYITDISPQHGVTFVDASIDQFCDEQHALGNVDVTLGPYETLPAVDIVLPDDARRARYEQLIIGGV